MGNRTSSSEYGGGVSDAATPVTRIYTPNVLNQYSPITNGQTVSVTGFRPNSSTAVTVNTVAPTYQSGTSGLYWWRNFTHTPGTTYENIIVRENGVTVAAGSQYVPPVSEPLAYDTDGNLTSDGRWAYTWDAENRLRMMTSHTSGSANRWRLTFSYDGLSRRIEKKTELQYSGAGGWFLTSWERYVYDGWNQILTVHMEDNGTTVRGRVSTNVWGPDLASLPYDRQTWQAAGGVAGLVLIRDGVSTFTGHAGWSAPTDPSDDDYFLFHDRLGNVTGYRKAVVGVAVGAMAAIYEYDAFGRELRASYDAVGSPNVKNMPYRFSTKFTDVESGLSYYGYRVYDPTKGRWLSRDPIWERGGLNLYAMVGNDPTNKIDIWGLDRHLTRTNPAVHHGIAVDIWDENCCNVIGKRYFDFAVDRSWLARIANNPLRPDSIKDAVQGILTIGLMPTVSAPGEVREPSEDGFPPDISETIQSTCEQDRALLKRMEDQMRKPDRYHCILHNCNHWTLGNIGTGIIPE